MLARLVGALALVAGCLGEPARHSCAPARKINEISSDSQEFTPFLAHDRHEIYFASNRDGNYNIYRGTRRTVDGTFDAVQQLTFAMVDTFDPVLSGDGNTLWLVQGSGDSGGQILQSPRDNTNGFSAYQQVFANLGTVLHPTFTDDGLWVYYAKSQTDVATNHDLYRAHRASTSVDFGDIEALPVNSMFDEADPAISADGGALLYETNNVDGGPPGTHIVQVSTRDFANPTLVTGLMPGDGTDEELGALHPDDRTIVYVSYSGSLSFDVWIYCE